ncbi:MAG: hypothetical protein IPI29_08590 [Ignavibacteria bacterium]|nr:hypothetical protein [Ignavibacteria bacterium]
MRWIVNVCTLPQEAGTAGANAVIVRLLSLLSTATASAGGTAGANRRPHCLLWGRSSPGYPVSNHYNRAISKESSK